jgi:thiamine pyrophosphokinase
VRAVIVGNGEPPSRELFAALMGDTKTVLTKTILICADGGANTAAAYGYIPALVIGDLDSLSGEARASLPADRQVSVVDQDATDLQKVLHQAVGMGITEADLIGFTGRRTDHTLWNLSQLKTFADQLRLRLLDDYCEIRLLGPGGIRFDADDGQKLSLCPLAGPVSGIKTQGLKWELHGDTLGPDRAGISNEVRASPVEIRIGAGDLLLVIQRDSGSGTIKVQSPT